MAAVVLVVGQEEDMMSWATCEGDTTARTPRGRYYYSEWGYPHAWHRRRRPFIQCKIHYAPPRRVEIVGCMGGGRPLLAVTTKTEVATAAAAAVETNARTAIVARLEWHAPRHTLAVTSRPIDQKSERARARAHKIDTAPHATRGRSRCSRAYDGGGRDGYGRGNTLRPSRRDRMCRTAQGSVR